MLTLIKLLNLLLNIIVILDLNITSEIENILFLKLILYQILQKSKSYSILNIILL